MIGQLIDKLLEDRTTFCTGLIAFPPQIAEIKLREHFDIGEHFFIRISGGINSRIIILREMPSSEVHLISINKPLLKSTFYSISSNDIEVISEYHGKMSIHSSLIHDIFSPLSIALISLAKPSIYTFPRFALGISDIATALRNQFKSTVCLFDLQLISKNALIEKMRNFPFQIIGLSMTFGLFDIMKELTSELIDIYPDSIIVIGGSLASIEYKEILKLFPSVIVSLGEGESALPRIVNWIQKNEMIEKIPDIAFTNEHGKIVVTEHTIPMENLSLPELDLLIDTIRAKGVFQIETSRGCYNACSFCPRRQKGKWRSIIGSINELESFVGIYVLQLSAHGFSPIDSTIYIVDEEFIGGDSRECRDRVESICAVFAKYNLHFEFSCRMNAIFTSTSSIEERKEKINNLMKIKQYGLKRLLIGVESGVDSVLIRFNKHVSALENIQGIRFLTAFGIPARFTYITFDPLMTFSELLQTYKFIGRRDLVIDPSKINNTTMLLDMQQNDEIWDRIALGIPFYHSISYMLVSLECLLGSGYYQKMKDSNLLVGDIVVSLGKQNAIYSDWRIGILHVICQLWIDHHFSLDYTLKSLSKIYPDETGKRIWLIRSELKDNSYRLLGKLLYLCGADKGVLISQPKEEIEFVTTLRQNHSSNLNALVLEDNARKVLTYQKDQLINSMRSLNKELYQILRNDDYATYLQHYLKWESNTSWYFIHE